MTMISLALLLLAFFMACANCNYEEKVRECKTKLGTVFKTPSPKDNIWYGLINLKTDMFSGQNPVSAEVEGYYFHLLHILEEHVKLTVISPKEFCNTTTSGNLYPTGRPATEWCQEAFVKLGCSSYDDMGFGCFRHIYLNWVLNEITVEKVFPDWIKTVPHIYRQDDSYVGQHKIDFQWQTENIISYITNHLKEKIMSLSNYYFFNWEDYCSNRIRIIGI